VVCYTATPLALQFQQGCMQVVRSNRVARNRLARGHSRYGPWTWRHIHTYIGTIKRNRTKHISKKKKTCMKSTHPKQELIFFGLLLFYHFFQKNPLRHDPVVHLFSSILFGLPICWSCKWFVIQYSVSTTTYFVPNSDKAIVKYRTLCQIKPREVQIAEYQFNSKTV